MSTIDEQFVEFVVKSLVNHPDDVKIERTIDKLGVLIKLTVNPEDLGRVIGKRGATAQSIRTLLRALGTKNEARYNFKIVDNGEPRPDREAHSPLPPAEESETKPETSQSAEVEEPEVDSEVIEKTESVVEPEESEESEDSEATAGEEEPMADELDEEAEEKPKPEVEGESLTQRTMDELNDLDDLEL